MEFKQILFALISFLAIFSFLTEFLLRHWVMGVALLAVAGMVLSMVKYGVRG